MASLLRPQSEVDTLARSACSAPNSGKTIPDLSTPAKKSLLSRVVMGIGLSMDGKGKVGSSTRKCCGGTLLHRSQHSDAVEGQSSRRVRLLM